MGTAAGVESTAGRQTFRGRRRPLRAALALIGFTSGIAQIVLMRELFVASHGNELSLGFALGVWLFWAALGSGAIGRFTGRISAVKLLPVLQLLCAVTPALAIWAARASRTWWQAAPGEILGPVPMVATAIVVLAIFCPLSGSLFSVGSRAWTEASAGTAAEGTSTTYLLEAAGSALGGVLAAVALLRFLNSLQIAVLLGMCNLGMAALFGIRRAWRRNAVVGVTIAAGIVAVVASARWEPYAAAGLWPGFRVLATSNSPYGSLAVLETEGNRSMVQNGVLLFTAPDLPSAEEAVHFALLTHPSPRHVLLIGGGLNGSVAEILQYRTVERVDYLELDPAVVRAAESYFPQQWQALRADPRVHTRSMDGRLFLKRAGTKFDVVIVNLPEPQTAQLNRFYTETFFREASAALTPGGVLAFQLRAAEEYISPELADFLRCIHATLRRVFPDVAVIPGETVHFIASNSAGVVTANPDVFVTRLRERGVRTKYVREYYLPYRMAQERVDALMSQIAPRADTRVNDDFTPVAYYFDAALWSTQFSERYRGAFRTAASVSFGRVAGAVVLALAIVGVAMLRRRERLAQRSAAAAVAMMGLALIGSQMLLLLGFQAIYGYVYQELAWIIAGFMAGLAVGSWRGLAARTRIPATTLKRLVAVQGAAVVAPLALVGLLYVLSSMREIAAIPAFVHITFGAAAVLCGVMGGYQFALATRMLFDFPPCLPNDRPEGERPGNSGPQIGFLYALDLAGSSVGAVVITAYLLPIFGLLRTAEIIAVANLLPLLLLTAACHHCRS